MNPEELFHQLLSDLSIKSTHPLHEAILHEVCEKAIENPQGVTDVPTLIYACQVAFLTNLKLLQSTLISSMDATDADQVTLNYRNQTFVIKRDLVLLKDAN